MNEKEILERIKEEDISIPDSVKPDAMRRRLDSINFSTQEEPSADLFSAKKRNRKKKWMRTATAIAATAAVLGGCVVCWQIFENSKSIPTEDTAILLPISSNTNLDENAYTLAYKKLKAYGTYEKLSRYFQSKKKTTMDFAENSIDQSADMTESTGSTSSTNVRTQGVDEGDLVKADADYIYTYSNYVSSDGDYKYALKIYEADSEDPKEVCDFKINTSEKSLDNLQIQDMYLYGDKLVFVGEQFGVDEKLAKEIYAADGGDFSNFHADSWYHPSYYENYSDMMYPCDGASYTRTLVYDISDRTKPVLESSTFQDGSLESSRMVDGIVYVITDRNFHTEEIKKRKPSTYIPQVCGQLLDEDAIYVEKDQSGSSYVVLSSYDITKHSYISKAANYGNSTDLYMSSQNLYILSNGERVKESRQKQDNAEDYTKIVTYRFKDGMLCREASGYIPGYTEDDYCLDEKDGYLRAVTTYYTKDTYDEVNGLFILDEDLKIVGKLTGIAKNESIYSSYFLGDTAYFVTFEQTDPLFAVDVSDPAHPTILSELKMNGYSDYLHPLDDTHLLGIGVDGDENGNLTYIKLALYDISDARQVKEVDKFILDYASYAEVLYNPNALYIDTDRKEFGFSAEFAIPSSHRKEINCDNYLYKADYLLFSYDDAGIYKKAKQTLKKDDEYWGDAIGRGVRIDETFYFVNVGEWVKALK